MTELLSTNCKKCGKPIIVKGYCQDCWERLIDLEYKVYSDPLKLTKKEQNLFAELCEILARFRGAESDFDKCMVLFENFLCKHDPAPQFWGQLYDKMHRQGANK